MKTKRCRFCGRSFQAKSHTRIYCSEECRKKQHAARYWYVEQPRTDGKKFAQLAREAADCNLDYGTYRALIEQGRTYSQIKATGYKSAAHSGVGGVNHRCYSWRLA